MLKMEMKEVLQGKIDHAAAAKMSQLLGSYLRHKESETPLPTPKKVMMCQNILILYIMEKLRHSYQRFVTSALNGIQIKN